MSSWGSLKWLADCLAVRCARGWRYVGVWPGLAWLAAMPRSWNTRASHPSAATASSATASIAPLHPAAGSSIPTDSPRFWSEAYTLRLTGTGLPAAPCFLLPLADGILAAGKAALLLQAYSSWRLAAAAARRSDSFAGSAAPAAGTSGGGGGSPSKRRLSEFGALGFAIAAGRQAEQHPYGVPPPVPAAAEGLVLLASEGPGVPGPEPLHLHQQLVRNLEEQLQEQLALVSDDGRGGGMQTSPPRNAGGAAATAPRSASPTSSRSSDSHVFQREWQAATAACSEHTLLLPAQDALPPLPTVPASAEQLPAAAAATISVFPEHSVAGRGAAEGMAISHSSSSSHGGGSRGGSGSPPSIANRMRAAAAARVAQATSPATEQLPQLMIPPAPLEALAAAAQAVGSPQAVSEAAAEAADQQFDGGAWQQWYARVAAALSQQLHVLDSIRSEGSGTPVSASSVRQPAGTFGVPLGLPRYTSARPSEQLWGRGGAGAAAGGGRSTMLGACAAQQLRPALAAEAPPLDVLLQDSLLRPVRAQVDAAGGALCTALLRHGLLRQVCTVLSLDCRGALGRPVSLS